MKNQDISWRRLLLAGFFAAILAACSSTSTSLEQSWKAPEIGSIQFKKILVIAVAPDGSMRRSAEDAMKRNIVGVPSVASYELTADSAVLKDRAKVAALVRDTGADGIIVMRPISNEKEVEFTPGSTMPPPYTRFYGYYTRPYAMSGFYSNPGTVTTTRVIGIETNIYETTQESLIWSGYTTTRDPANVQALVDDVAMVVKAKLREQKLIP